MNTKTSRSAAVRSWISRHKFWSTVIIAIVIIGGYEIYHKATTAAAIPQYSLAMVRMGTITQTVTGSGQVSASNQTDILAQGSGSITSIKAKVGQEVVRGDLIATIDSTNAAISLRNAQISLAKLTEPAKATDIGNAQANNVKAYNDGFNAAANIYLDLPAIMAGMKDLLYGQTGFLSYTNSSQLNSSSLALLNKAGVEFDRSGAEYQKSLEEFGGLTRSSATSSIDSMLSDTYITIKDVSEAVTDAQNAVTSITTYQPEYKPSGATAAAANVKTWAGQANSDLGAVVSAQNSIQSNANSLTTLLAGTDSLDIEQARLSLEQAQQAYANYFVRAPYDGIIGRIPVNVYGQAGASTVIATIVGEQKIANISLNEVDAAKVSAGQSVNITFDAIDGIDATGTVEQIDQVGAVSSGVVSYAVKILINTSDERIKPGMSVNTSIITKQDDNVLVVPSSAVKSQGNVKYVQVFPNSVLSSVGSSTRQFASTTRQFPRALTISSKTPPTQAIVTVGDSDDTNTEILTGLNRGQLVVTKTVAAGGASAAAAPSILNTLGGARGAGAGGGGAFRAGGGGARPAGN